MSDSDEEPPQRGPQFRPVPVRPRKDGWTPERQQLFIEALAETGCVDQASSRVGMSSETAYRLRRRVDALEFRLAWDAAIDVCIPRLEDGVISRAIHGVRVPHYFQGELVGEHRSYDNRLAMWLLSHRLPGRYGRWREDEPAAPEVPHRRELRLFVAIRRLLEIAQGLVQRSFERRAMLEVDDLDEADLIEDEGDEEDEEDC